MSELALKLIAENKRSKATFLDLGNCGLKVLPDELAELVWLEKLNLGDGWHDWGADLYRYTMSKNKGESNKALKDIGLLAKLPLLQVIGINDSSVDNLAPLAGLKKLRNINALNCPLSHFQDLTALKTLQVLLCYSKLIKDASPLSDLSALQHLYLDSTQVNDPSPLSRLSQKGLRMLL